MKLIQISPNSAFLAWPQMSICLVGKMIYFGFGSGIGPTSSIHEFACLNEHTAKQCYKYLIECLGDPDCASCDLPYREAIYAACWHDAPIVAPLILALFDKQKEDRSFPEIKPFKDAVAPHKTYCNLDGHTTAWGNVMLQFYTIQKSTKK